MTNPTSTQVAVENHPCAVCGGLDNHPMIHTDIPRWVNLEGTTFQFPSFHFDCLPGEIEYRLGTDDTHPQHWVTREAIKAAKAGVHGDALRKHIGNLANKFNDNAYGEVAPHTLLAGDVADPTAEVEPHVLDEARRLSQAYESVKNGNHLPEGTNE